jgi:hypothetical protein
MSSSYTNSDWPKKCFNGQNSYHFGWYSDRQKSFDPLIDGNSLLQLVSFVEYDKTPDYAFVNVAIADKYYLQYNVAEKFNVNTGDKANQVTIVEKYDSGTNLVTGLSAGSEWKFSNYQGSGKTLIIHACGQGEGEFGAKTMLMSIALDTSLCATYDGAEKFSTQPPRSGGCFSAHNKVEVLGKGMIDMKSLNIGDFARVKNGEFSQVYSFGHLDQHMLAEFLQISFTNDSNIPLEITADHMVFLSSGEVVRASQIQVGDILSGKRSAVQQIQIAQRRGVYAPVTYSGDIVVSGVVASSYVAVLDGVPSHILNTVSHAIMGLHRLACTLDFDLCRHETYNDDGINIRIASVVEVVMTLNQLTFWIQMALSVLLSPLVALFFMAPSVAFVSMMFFLRFRQDSTKKYVPFLRSQKTNV